MEDQACPKCKTTVYRNPNMKLMVNVCGHNLCENCVDLLFAKGSGSCPECNIPLRRSNFRIQLFEDSQIDKEVDIRKRVLKDFTMKEEDFGTLREYNDYLEMVEEIIYNLCNNIDLIESNKRIAEWKEKNKDFIAKNRHRTSREALELEDILADEARIGKLRQKQTEEEHMNQKKLKAQNKEKLIDDLMFSDVDAKTIVSQHEEVISKTEATTTLPKLTAGIDASNALHNYRPSAPIAEAEQYIYSLPTEYTEGPDLPSNYATHSGEFNRHVRQAESFELAGGYHHDIACLRALQEGLSGLFFTPTT